MKWALVTGASSGLGEEFAWQLSGEPLGLVLVARRRSRLEALATKLRTVSGVPVEVLAADLSGQPGRDLVINRLNDQSKPVALLVNNAGAGLGQDFINGDIERENQALDLMVKAVMQLSHAGARAMLKTGGGAIINVSSATAYTAMGTYGAHKSWVRFFTEALSQELAGTKVSATALCPGVVATEFHEAAQMDAQVWPSWAFLEQGKVVSAAIEAARRRQVLVTPSLLYKVQMAAVRLAPRPVVRTLAGPRLFARALTKR